MLTGNFYSYFLAVSRPVCALFSLFFVITYIRYYLSDKPINNVYAELLFKNGKIQNILSPEIIIGKGSKADIKIRDNGVRGRHAVLCVHDGEWILSPCAGKVLLNSNPVRVPVAIYYGDNITIGSTTFKFKEHKQPQDISSRRKVGPSAPLFFLTLLQSVICITLCLRYTGEINPVMPISFIGLILAEWIYFAVSKNIKNSTMFMELCVMYLSTVGLAICSTVASERLLKQVICYVIGFIGYLVFTAFLKSFPIKYSIRLAFMAGSILLLYITAFFGTEINNSKNWLSIGGFSFQPSELCKVAFIFVGCITLYTVILNKKRNWEFIIYSVLCMGALAIMLDFGAVAIFFVGMIVLLNIRLTNPLLTGGICVGFGAIGIVALTIYPYIVRRFEVWLHAWEHASSSGYQQTRTMIATASGGLLGVGGGNGYLSSIAASETDLVFGIVCEEWGSIMGIAVAFCLVMLGLYAYRLAKSASSLFYTCGVCAVAAMFIFQSALNIFGSLDILPLTGVTLIFISCGGTSVISAWLMMAFYKAAEISCVDVDGWGKVP